MRNIKKFFGLLFSLLFTVALIYAKPVKAEAAYTYRIRVVLGGSGDENASFNSDLGLSVPTGAKVEFTKYDRDNPSKPIEMEISNLSYGAKVTMDPAKMVSIAPATKQDDEGNEIQYSKYYVKGVRVAGKDTVLHAASFNVTYDETFVVAYGVGEVVPYIVNYVDKNGNPIVDPEGNGIDTIQPMSGYGAAGEELYVPYRNIPGYKPNTYNYHTKSLKAPEIVDGSEKPFEFTFYYSKITDSSETVEETVEVIDKGTVVGATEYSYRVVGGNTTSVISNQTAGITNATGNNNTVNNTSNNSTNRDTNGRNSADGELVDSVDINGQAENINPDEPQDVIEIEDDITARGNIGQDDDLDHYTRNAVAAVVVAVLAVLTLGATAIIVYKKKKK